MAKPVTQEEISKIEKKEEVNPVEIEIYRKYPPKKQSQDRGWESYYVTLLEYQGEADVRKKVVGFIIEFEDGKSLDEIVKDIEVEKQEAYKKLIKVGVRLEWAKKYIDEYKLSLLEDREPNYPPFPSL